MTYYDDIFEEFVDDKVCMENESKNDTESGK